MKLWVPSANHYYSYDHSTAGTTQSILQVPPTMKQILCSCLGGQMPEISTDTIPAGTRNTHTYF